MTATITNPTNMTYMGVPRNVTAYCSGGILWPTPVTAYCSGGAISWGHHA